jgi:hypothetical protein
MGWSGGSYTKGNNATGGWTGDASLGIGIEAGRHDTQDNDFATGINQCLNKDGSNAATGPLNAGGFKLTNVAVGTASTDSVTLGQAQAGINTQGTALATTHTRFSADAVGPYVTLRKSRNATLGVNTIVQNGDQIGAIVFDGANGTGYNSGSAIIGSVDGVPGATNDMPGALRFYTTPDGSGALIERMIVKSSGRIGIGTGVPTAFTHIANPTNTTINGLNIEGTTAGDVGVAGLGIIKKDAATTTSQIFIQFAVNGGTGNGQINANGVNAAAFGSFSDIRLKENVVDLPSQLESIRNLRPVEFDYKDGSGHQIGFIAQEVQAVYPDVVGESNGFLTLTDMNKNDARLIKAFQELYDKVKLLEARVAELEA